MQDNILTENKPSKQFRFSRAIQTHALDLPPDAGRSTALPGESRSASELWGFFVYQGTSGFYLHLTSQVTSNLLYEQYVPVCYNTQLLAPL